MEEGRYDKLLRTTGIAIGVILLHGAVFLLGDHFMPKPPPKAPIKIQQITVAKGQLTKNQAKQPQKSKSKPQKVAQKRPKKEKKVDLKKLDGQIVNLPPSPDSRPPDEAKYLSSYNTRTEKETKARNPDKDFTKVANKRSGQQKKVPPKGRENAQKLQEPTPELQTGSLENIEKPLTAPKPKVAMKEAADGTFRNQEATVPKKGQTLKYSLKLSPTPTMPQPQQETIGLADGLESLKIFPDLKQMEDIMGSPANDYLPDVEEGDGTFLNSKEFKYASFFNRIHQSVSQNWYPNNILEQRDPTGNMYGYKDRLTVVSIVLNGNGRLMDIRISKPSGVYALDDEAVAAFKRAEPFPHPPAALLDQKGRIEFNFGFQVEYDHFSIGRF